MATSYNCMTSIKQWRDGWAVLSSSGGKGKRRRGAASPPKSAQTPARALASHLLRVPTTLKRSDQAGQPRQPLPQRRCLQHRLWTAPSPPGCSDHISMH